MSRFSTVLVANRGEIACRVMRSARALGYRTVAVYSEADAEALHVQLADLATCIGPAPVSSSYLVADAIIAAAKRTGADAVHPGYGFLSENADFARACREAGLVFIGPTPEAIHSMGNKAASKRLVIEADVPTIPGYQGTAQDEATLQTEANRVGYPLLIKASAGGGGRGMRLVTDPSQFPNALRTARAEAESAFGNGEVLLERALVDARHVEVQVFGDELGNVVHLGERDCSVQRRHQKIVEESPSPAVDPALRARMGAAAVAAAKRIGYVGAGTVEFLLDRDGSFYFLEMNTRLQVEHPVTELVTGLDLVALQLRVAQGEAIPFTQEEVTLRGAAIEVRLYAEDPHAGFLPQTGDVLAFSPGTSEQGALVDGRRIDHGLREGQTISPFYDPMLAKVIAYGKDREEARRRLVHLLEDTVLLGSVVNKTFLLETLKHPVFVAGKASTAFIGAHMIAAGETAPKRPVAPNAVRAVSALLATLDGNDIWSSTADARYTVRVDFGQGPERLLVRSEGRGVFDVTVGEAHERIHVVGREGRKVRWSHGDVMRTLTFARSGGTTWVDDGTYVLTVAVVVERGAARDAGQGTGRVIAPMNGRIVDVRVSAGEKVTRGQVLVVLEAMKMQHEIAADVDGSVEEVLVSKDAQVGTKQLLVQVKPGEA
jgi:geranyl-CoA carboxylase alpha subunit